MIQVNVVDNPGKYSCSYLNGTEEQRTPFEVNCPLKGQVLVPVRLKLDSGSHGLPFIGK